MKTEKSSIVLVVVFVRKPWGGRAHPAVRGRQHKVNCGTLDERPGGTQ